MIIKLHKFILLPINQYKLYCKFLTLCFKETFVILFNMEKCGYLIIILFSQKVSNLSHTEHKYLYTERSVLNS